MFTVYAEELGGFDTPRVNDNTPKLAFPIYGGPPGVKMVASWCELRNMSSTDPIHTGSGEIVVRFPNGQSKAGWLVGPPIGNPCDRFALLITPEEISSLSTDVGPCLIFLGGFDSGQIALDQSKEVRTKPPSNPATMPALLKMSFFFASDTCDSQIAASTSSNHVAIGSRLEGLPVSRLMFE